MYKQEPLDELVLMSTNQMAGPPIEDSADLPFGSSNPNLDESALFPTAGTELGDEGDQGLFSLLATNMNPLTDQLTSSSLVLDVDDSQIEDRGASRPGSGTISSSNKSGALDSKTNLARQSQSNEGHLQGGDLEIDRDFFGELDDMPTHELTRISSSAASSAVGPAVGPAIQKPVPKREQGIQTNRSGRIEDSIFPNIRANAKKSIGASTVRSEASQGNQDAKIHEEPLALLDDDKENGTGQKPTRLRYSKGAAPSKYCHVCGRSAKTVSVALCGNNKLGLCRKVVCDKCLIMHQWGDFRSAKESESSWICTHCRGDCPARARCHQYQRNNMRRRLKSNTTANQRSVGVSATQRSVGIADIGNLRAGIPQGTAGTKPNQGAIPLQQSGRITLPGRTVPTIPPVPGMGDIMTDTSTLGKPGTMVTDFTPTNIMGASTAFAATPSTRPTMNSAPGGGMYTHFNP